jgi:hypothetical protein
MASSGCSAGPIFLVISLAKEHLQYFNWRSKLHKYFEAEAPLRQARVAAACARFQEAGKGIANNRKISPPHQT